MAPCWSMAMICKLAPAHSYLTAPVLRRAILTVICRYLQNHRRSARSDHAREGAQGHWVG